MQASIQGIASKPELRTSNFSALPLSGKTYDVIVHFLREEWI